MKFKHPQRPDRAFTPEEQEYIATSLAAMRRRPHGTLPGTPVIVRWEDAYISVSPDSEVRTVEYVSIGFLVEETDERIAIAQSRCAGGDAEILTIPAGIVRQVTVI